MYENAGFDGYVTEKIFDAWFAGCVPVYLGAPNVTDYIPAETFIDRNRFNGYEELYRFLKTMPEKQYRSYVEAIEEFLGGGKDQALWRREFHEHNSPARCGQRRDRQIPPRRDRQSPAMNPPLVSICTPTFNRPELLARAVQSCLAQTHRNFEIVITDNSDGEASREIITRLNDPRIRYYKNDENIGGVKNLLKVLSLARGKYISLLMDDDLLKPRALELMVEAFEKNPTVGIVMAPMALVDEDDRRIFPYFYFVRKTDLPLSLPGRRRPGGTARGVEEFPRPRLSVLRSQRHHVPDRSPQ